MAAKPTKSGARAARPRSAPGLSIVVPLFNEAKGLAGLHERIAEVARFLKVKRGLAVEVVYVDDGSRDDTCQIAKSLPAMPLDIQVVSAVAQFRQGGRSARRPRPCPARRRAVHGRRRPASADLIETLVARWLDDGYDVVYTAKAHRENEPWLRRARRQIVLRADQLGRAPQDSRRTPATSACCRRARRRRCARCRNATASSRGWRAGSASARCASTMSRPSARTARPRWNVWTLIGLSIEGLTSFSVAPLRVASLLGLLLAVTALFFGGWILLRDLALRQGRARLSLAGGRRDGDRRRAAGHDRRAGRIYRQDAVRDQRRGRSISSPNTA